MSSRNKTTIDNCQVGDKICIDAADGSSPLNGHRPTGMMIATIMPSNGNYNPIIAWEKKDEVGIDNCNPLLLEIKSKYPRMVGATYIDLKTPCIVLSSAPATKGKPMGIRQKISECKVGDKIKVPLSDSGYWDYDHKGTQLDKGQFIEATVIAPSDSYGSSTIGFNHNPKLANNTSSMADNQKCAKQFHDLACSQYLGGSVNVEIISDFKEKKVSSSSSDKPALPFLAAYIGIGAAFAQFQTTTTSSSKKKRAANAAE